jgi:hypothetical protein
MNTPPKDRMMRPAPRELPSVASSEREEEKRKGKATTADVLGHGTERTEKTDR